ncbi:ERBB receptor feedback inhibitor 1a [Hippocampus comes]|uniref:ERBB receptor feedback inhibitor 1a n=1 Tax=Hippocampus comes TaxID=109280 RepID=UPI00094E67E3|nr:PREDICTED: ERBB receptor feedback inhibitor 1 [Hippocampus comes]
MLTPNYRYKSGSQPGRRSESFLALMRPECAWSMSTVGLTAQETSFPVEHPFLRGSYCHSMAGSKSSWSYTHDLDNFYFTMKSEHTDHSSHGQHKSPPSLSYESKSRPLSTASFPLSVRQMRLRFYSVIGSPYLFFGTLPILKLTEYNNRYNCMTVPDEDTEAGQTGKYCLVAIGRLQIHVVLFLADTRRWSAEVSYSDEDKPPKLPPRDPLSLGTSRTPSPKSLPTYINGVMPTTQSFAPDPKYVSRGLQRQNSEGSPCILPIVDKEGKKASSTHYYLLPHRPTFVDSKSVEKFLQTLDSPDSEWDCHTRRKAPVDLV